MNQLLNVTHLKAHWYNWITGTSQSDWNHDWGGLEGEMFSLFSLPVRITEV